jgi:putative Ig domain-containing protein
MMHRLFVGLIAISVLAGCGGSGSGADASTATAQIVGPSSNLSAVAGQPFTFVPAIKNMGSGTLTFSATNTPSWAQFSTSTGELSGTPTAAEVGTYANIVISASEGTSEAATPAFSIVVTDTGNGSASLSWAAPTENTNGTALTNLAGYWINYGTSAANLSQKVQIDNPGISSYVVSNLSPGTWYFSITAYTADNLESAPSAIANYIVD